jgi:hypothetical protein
LVAFFSYRLSEIGGVSFYLDMGEKYHRLAGNLKEDIACHETASASRRMQTHHLINKDMFKGTVQRS